MLRRWVVRHAGAGARRCVGDVPAAPAAGGAADPPAAPAEKVAPEVVLPRLHAPYLDFSGVQCDAVRAAGVITTEPGSARSTGLAGREVDAPPEKLSKVMYHRLAEQWRPLMIKDLEPAHRSMREYVEEMMELHSETDTPAQTLLRIYRCFPNLHERMDEAFAVVFLRYHELAEEAYREGRVVKYFQSTVYPLYLCLRLDIQRRDLGPQVRRAIEMYLTAAADRGEVSLNHANYIIQNLLETEALAERVMKVDLLTARGSFKDVVTQYNDGELELKHYAMLMGAVPNFFDTFPSKTPVSRDEFLSVMRQHEVMYVLHASYLLQGSPHEKPPGAKDDEPTTILGRAKALVELIEMDDDAEVLLVPHWTLHDLVVAGVDHETREDITETLQFLAGKWCKDGSKVRFVWQSETVTPLVNYKTLKTSLERRDDKTLMFAKWLDSSLPPLSKQELQDHDIDLKVVENRIQNLQRALHDPDHKVEKMVGSRDMPVIIGKSQMVQNDVRQGTILLAHDPEVLAHCNNMGLWAEPQKHSGMLNEVDQLKALKWYRFYDGLAVTRTKKKLVAKGKKMRKAMKTALREVDVADPNPIPKHRRFKTSTGYTAAGRRVLKPKPRVKKLKRRDDRADRTAAWRPGMASGQDREGIDA